MAPPNAAGSHLSLFGAALESGWTPIRVVDQPPDISPALGAVRARKHGGAHLARWLAAALALGGCRFELLQFIAPGFWLELPPGSPSGIDRRPLHESLDPLPSDLSALIAVAVERIPHGATVRYRPPSPEPGASYAYYRVAHALAGRRLLRPDSTEAADWVLAWRLDREPPGYRLVWSRNDATLWALHDR